MMSDVVMVLGAFGCPLINFIFPTYFYLKLHPECPFYKKIVLIGVFGVFMLIFAIYALLDIFYGISDIIF
jgi:hypothetical protein